LNQTNPTMVRFIALFSLCLVALSHAYPSGKIIGGQWSYHGEFPHLISLRFNNVHICGGSILDANTIVTAGQCIVDQTIANFRVFAGINNVQNPEAVTVQERAVSSIVRHENYNGGTNANDIAIIKLSTPLTFNSFVSAVALPPAAHEDKAAGNAWVTGWGMTREDDNGSYLPLAQKVQVPIVTDTACRAALGANLLDNMVCAGEAGKDSCTGDAGGPLMCSDTGSPYLCGIVSWGVGCGRPNLPGAYTEVAYFSSWIESARA